MPKQIDYPRASLKNALQLAQGVNDLGGSSSIELAADKLGKKGGGAFAALVGAATKYGLIVNKGGQLTVTPLFRDYKLAYSKTESDLFAQQAFLSVPLFRSIHQRFMGNQLPVAHFEKLLIRELHVPDNIASRVARYFVEGAKQVGLMTQDNSVVPQGSAATNDSVIESEESGNDSDATTNSNENVLDLNKHADTKDAGAYVIRIKGPGIDSAMTIHEEGDLAIVQAMLKKIERKLQQQEGGDGN
jgi:hypothetical protein